MYKIVVIESFKRGLGASIDRLQQEHPELGQIQAYLLATKLPSADLPDGVTSILCDYSEEQLMAAFQEIGPDVKTVICRGDMYIQYLRKVLPYLDPNAFVASESSLKAATNKRLMREAFIEFAPEITPLFIKVDDSAPDTIERIASTVTFPVIIKPASLASSLLIQKCDTKEQLSSGLEATFSVILATYEREGRHEVPEVVVEEFLEGDFYSIDSYISDESTISHCPLVQYVPAKSMGIDDFFLYKRWTPVGLSTSEVSAAQIATEKAIKALGLRYTSTHTELIRTKNGWKIIEIGPRIGRFRNTMYKASFGIDHGYNDLLLHVGMHPEVIHEMNNNSAAYSIYPHQEGKLVTIAGIDELDSHLDHILYRHISNRDGQEVKPAKNGGHALAEVVFADEDYQKFTEQCGWFEEHVFADVTLEGA